jgi:hypothetical protein
MGCEDTGTICPLRIIPYSETSGDHCAQWLIVNDADCEQDDLRNTLPILQSSTVRAEGEYVLYEPCQIRIFSRMEPRTLIVPHVVFNVQRGSQGFRR